MHSLQGLQPQVVHAETAGNHCVSVHSRNPEFLLHSTRSLRLTDHAALATLLNRFEPLHKIVALICCCCAGSLVIINKLPTSTKKDSADKPRGTNMAAESYGVV